MAYRDVVLADDPAGYWRLGESSGSTAYDETSNGYDATYQGDPALGVTGAILDTTDTAVDFDGSGDYVDAGDIIDPMTSSCSFELWVNMDTLEAERGLVLKDDGNTGWGVQLGDGTADGNVRFFQRGASTVILATTTDPVATGQWHHIVAVYDSSTGDRQIYVDAALEASDTIATGGFASASAKLAIAARRDGSDAVDGQVDEVAVYTAALSASQIQQHYDEARKVELDAHVSVLEHKPLFPGSFEAHTIESVHFPLGYQVGLPAHTSILVHQDLAPAFDKSEEGQAKALRAALGYGWGVPDPKGSAQEKIETPRESWPIERTSEAKRLMHDQGVDPQTSEGMGEAMRKLGEDISHDVRTNLQRYEWHANTHKHPVEGLGLEQVDSNCGPGPVTWVRLHGPDAPEPIVRHDEHGGGTQAGSVPRSKPGPYGPAAAVDPGEEGWASAAAGSCVGTATTLLRFRFYGPTTKEGYLAFADPAAGATTNFTSGRGFRKEGENQANYRLKTGGSNSGNTWEWPIPVTLDIWHMIIARHNPETGDIKVWVDGLPVVFDNIGTDIEGIHDDDLDFLAGQNTTGSLSYQPSGVALAEFAAWDRPLTDNEVSIVFSGMS